MPHPKVLQRAVLALDPGGTKCDALLVAPDGTVLGGARVHRPGASGRTARVIREAATRALAGRRVRQLGVVGSAAAVLPAGTRLGRAVVRHCAQIDEEYGPLALVGARYGLVVIAGTGARVYACTRGGEHVSLDGFGPMIGDFGSGYQIGLAALRATARAALHGRHHTSLRPRVFAACEELARRFPVQFPTPPKRRREVTGVLARRLRLRSTTWLPDPEAARIWHLVWFSLSPHDRSVVASLARIVDEEARAGDPVARRILREAAASLAETVRDAVAVMGLARQRFPVIGIGSVALESDLYWTTLGRLVRRFAPRARFVRCPLPPVAGNALVGLSAWQHGQIRPGQRRRLIETAHAYYASASP